jgi:hypothetical protein
MSTEALDVLRSIDASLKELVKIARGRQPKAIASDRDLDGRYGNPVVKFMPRDWTGATYKGRPFSDCPADLLDMLAETLEYFATQSEAKNELTDRGKPLAEFKRADAARARGWAKRVREGRVPATAAAAAPTTGEDDRGWGDADGNQDWE